MFTEDFKKWIADYFGKDYEEGEMCVHPSDLPEDDWYSIEELYRDLTGNDPYDEL